VHGDAFCRRRDKIDNKEIVAYTDTEKRISEQVSHIFGRGFVKGGDEYGKGSLRLGE